MRVRRQANVVEGSVGIVAGDENRTAIEIAGVLGGVSECVHRPGSIICIRSKIMDARLIGGNRRISGEFGWRRSEENSSTTGKHPGLVELRDIQVHVRTGVFDAGRNIVNDEAKIMGVGGEPNVVERSVSIVAGDKNRTATKISRVLGCVSKCI